MIIDMPTVSMGVSGSLVSADRVSYDNTTSGLEAENVQDAVDEVKEALDDSEYHVGDVIKLINADDTQTGCNAYGIGFTVGNPAAIRLRYSLEKPIGKDVTSARVVGRVKIGCYCNSTPPIPEFIVDNTWNVALLKDCFAIMTNTASLVSGSFPSNYAFFMPTPSGPNLKEGCYIQLS